MRRILVAASAAMLATPPFLIGFLLLLFVALKLSLAPAGGWSSGFTGDLTHVWLPALALAVFLSPIVMRAVRQSALETNEEQFVEAAVSRGFRQRLPAGYFFGPGADTARLLRFPL